MSAQRILCLPEGSDSVFTMTSKAGPIAMAGSLFLVEPPEGVDQVSRADVNLYRTRHAVPVRFPGQDRLQLLFDAVPALSSSEPHRLFLGEADLLNGVTTAKRLAKSVEPSEDALQVAKAQSLKLRNFGASSEGKFLLVPEGSSLRLVDAASGRALSALALDPRETFFPSLDETRGVLSALAFSGGVFRPVFVELDVKSGSVKRTQTPGGARSGFSAGSAQKMSDGTYYWSEASAAGSALDLASWNPKTGAVSRLRIETPVSGARVFPQSAVYEVGGKVFVAVAIEKIVKVETPRGPTLKAEAAKLALFSLSGGKAQVSAEVPYPIDVAERIEKNGTEYRAFAMTSLFSSPDRREVFSVLPGPFGPQIYKLRGPELSAVSQEPCDNPNLIQEAEF